MWMAKQKVLLLVNRKDAQLEHVTEISLAQRMVTLLVSSLVTRTDVDLEKLMEMRWAQPMEANLDQMTDILKEMCLVELLAVMMVLMTVCCWAHLMESGLEQTMVLMMETSSACLLAL